MECFQKIREWIQPGAFLIGIDLKDQFLSVSINKKFRKFLRFRWLGKLFEWCSLPFGLKCSPRVVTKLLRPVMAFLRTVWNVCVSVYMDDMILQNQSADQCFFHAQILVLVLLSLGWEVNWEKSNFIPSNTLVHLGFKIDTVSMTATCPEEKLERLRSAAKTALEEGSITVLNLEKLLGLIESVRPVTPHAALNYRSLQRQLLKNKFPVRRPATLIKLSATSKANLVWWSKETGFKSNCTAPLQEPTPTLHIWSDASMQGCGSHTSRGEYTQRVWSDGEKSLHINHLELRSAREAAKEFALPGDRIRLHIDSKVACAYVRKQGGTRSTSLSQEACLLWDEMIQREVSILTPHWISTSDNSVADFLTRQKGTTWEFKLNPILFSTIMTHFDLQPTLDSFASSETRQLPRYMSWDYEEDALGRDALLCRWDEVTYCFPPIPLIPKVMNKIRDEKIDAILVCPEWPASLWWMQVKQMLVAPPFPLPPFRQSLLPVGQKPIQVFLDPLVAVHVSGRV